VVEWELVRDMGMLMAAVLWRAKLGWGEGMRGRWWCSLNSDMATVVVTVQRNSEVRLNLLHGGNQAESGRLQTGAGGRAHKDGRVINSRLGVLGQGELRVVLHRGIVGSGGGRLRRWATTDWGEQARCADKAAKRARRGSAACVRCPRIDLQERSDVRWVRAAGGGQGGRLYFGLLRSSGRGGGVDTRMRRCCCCCCWNAECR
jgi:hypothetical protein